MTRIPRDLGYNSQEYRENKRIRNIIQDTIAVAVEVAFTDQDYGEDRLTYILDKIQSGSYKKKP